MTRQVREILEGSKGDDPQLDSFLQQLKFQLSQKYWYEFGQTLLDLIYTKRDFPK